MYKFILTALVVLSPSVALAGGGGGSKGNTGTINVTNGSASDAYVVLDPSNAMTDFLAKPNPTAAEFTKLGGKILGEGETFTFKNVKVGKHVIRYAYPTATAVGTISTQNVTVAKGKTYSFDLFGI